MPVLKKIIIGVISFILFLLLVNFGLNFWANQQLSKIIYENNTTPYYITYKDLKISFWSGSIMATGIIIVPKTSLKDSLNKVGVYSKIESVEVNELKIWNLVFSDKISAKSIVVNKPHILIYKKDENAINNSKSIRSEIVDSFQKIIIVSDIYLNKGDFKIVSIKNKPILSAQNINVKLEGIVITDEILKNKIPFSYCKYSFNCDSIYYRTNEFYHLKVAQLQTEKNGLSIKKLALIPEYSRREFVKKILEEKDLYTVYTDSIQVRNLKWGFKNNKLFFNAGAIIVDKLSANIYRNLIPPENLEKSLLYSERLRNLSFPLKLDTLTIRKSIIVYEEQENFGKIPAVLTLSKFNLDADHIQSSYGQKKLPDLKIKINFSLMDAALLKADWTFNVLDQTDGFNINGTVLNLDAEKLTPFSKPYIKTTLKGHLDKLDFNITGNDKIAKGSIDLKYHNLKVTYYKKKGIEKEAKLKTAFANLLIKNDSKGQSKNAKVELKRIPEKSIYNFVWSCVGKGIKKILI